MVVVVVDVDAATATVVDVVVPVVDDVFSPRILLFRPPEYPLHILMYIHQSCLYLYMRACESEI